jgi:hypothetical protein
MAKPDPDVGRQGSAWNGLGSGWTVQRCGRRWWATQEGRAFGEHKLGAAAGGTIGLRVGCAGADSGRGLGEAAVRGAAEKGAPKRRVWPREGARGEERSRAARSPWTSSQDTGHDACAAPCALDDPEPRPRRPAPGALLMDCTHFLGTTTGHGAWSEAELGAVSATCPASTWSAARPAPSPPRPRRRRHPHPTGVNASPSHARLEPLFLLEDAVRSWERWPSASGGRGSSCPPPPGSVWEPA